MGDELWSGWGIRTMSTGDAAYNPLSYHNGTVWPHDTSLGAWGLARAGRSGDVQHDRAARCSTRRATSTGRCPRSSPASARGETPFPIAYPTAARPQAWAAGHAGAAAAAPARARARRRDAGAARRPRTRRPTGSDGLELDGVRAFGRAWDVARRGRASVMDGEP